MGGCGSTCRTVAKLGRRAGEGGGGRTLDGIVDPIVYQEAVNRSPSIKRPVAASSSSPRPGPGSWNRSVPASEVDKAIGAQMVIEDGLISPATSCSTAYGPGKADAMQQLAGTRNYDLADSYAYSDSYTDLPMLEVVKAVRGQPRQTVCASGPGQVWPVRFAKPVAMKRLPSPRNKDAAVRRGGSSSCAPGWPGTRGIGDGPR